MTVSELQAKLASMRRQDASVYIVVGEHGDDFRPLKRVHDLSEFIALDIHPLDKGNELPAARRQIHFTGANFVMAVDGRQGQ